MVSLSTTLVVFALLFFGYAHAGYEEPDVGDYSDLSYGVSDFSAKFLNEVAIANKGESVICSPLSLIYVLFMTYLGAKGRTASEIIKAIGVPKNQAPDQFAALTNALADLQGVTFNMANKIYVKSGKNYKLDAQYNNDVIDTVDSEVEFINFNQKAQAAKKINAWVEKQTNNKIKNLVSEDDFNSLTRLVLINAIHFKGTWQKTFNKKATRAMTFHITQEETTELPTMTMKARVPYAKDDELGCKILKLDYAGGNASMVILLPDDIEGVEELNQKLAKDSNLLYNALGKLSVVEVDMRIPKFKTEIKIDAKALLPKLGVKQVFDPAKARLDYMLENPEQLYVSKIIQKAIIEVDEDGAEAAAATAAVIMTRSVRVGPRPPTFYVDHGFIHFIYIWNEVAIFGGTYKGK